MPELARGLARAALTEGETLVRAALRVVGEPRQEKAEDQENDADGDDSGNEQWNLLRGRTLRAVGVLLVAGGLFSIGLDVVGAPDAVLRVSYEHLLSGLDAPPEPSTFAVDLVRYTALAGGVLQLLAGLVVFGIGIRRERG